MVWNYLRESPRLGVRGAEDVQGSVVCVEGLSGDCCTGAPCAVMVVIYPVINYGLASMLHVPLGVVMTVAHR